MEPFVETFNGFIYDSICAAITFFFLEEEEKSFKRIQSFFHYPPLPLGKVEEAIGRL
jgi:hypothetical protein